MDDTIDPDAPAYAGPPLGSAPQGPLPGGFPPPSNSSFFTSLRSSGWFRPDDRVIGGVCSAIHARTGWDLTLIRGVVVIATLFAPMVLTAYGVAWLLLPEQRDGRIHAEELLAGRFDIAQLGAGLIVLVGSASVIPFGALFGSDSIIGWGVGSTIIISFVAIAIALVTTRSRKAPMTPMTPPGPPRPMPSQGAPFTGGPVPGPAPRPVRPCPGPVPPNAPGPMGPMMAAPGPIPTEPIPPQMPLRRPNAYHAPVPAQPWVAPVLPPARVVSRRANLIVTGIAFLIVAATFLLMHLSSTPKYGLARSLPDWPVIGLIGGGAALAFVGLSLAVASFKDRGASALIALSLVGMFLAMPTTIVGMSYRAEDVFSLERAFERAFEPAYYDWTTDSIPDNPSAMAELDLTDAPADETKTIEVDSDLFGLTILVRSDQALRIVCDGTIEQITSSHATGTPNSGEWLGPLGKCAASRGSHPVSATATNPAWADQPGITVHVTGSVFTLEYAQNITDEAPQSVPAAPQSGQPASPPTAPQSGRS